MLLGFFSVGCGSSPDLEPTAHDEPGIEASLGELQQPLSFACGPSCCDVRQFGAVQGDGRDDAAAFRLAIRAALAVGHHYVYIPNGTWDIGSSVDMTDDAGGRVIIAGQSSRGTRLRWMGNLDYSIFNSTRGHSSFRVDLRTMTLDGSHLPYSSGTGHGVGVGNGWDSGYLHMANLNIIHPGFYGVGIQNEPIGKKPVRGVWLMDSFISGTGSDGIDLKAPLDSNNYDVHINNVVFHDIGKSERAIGSNGVGSDAAIDMTADGFGIYRVTIVTPAYVRQPNGTNYVQGIRLRRRGSISAPSAKNGSINRAYIKYPEHGIFFEGYNNGIVVERTTIKSVPEDGIVLRGTGNVIANTVCAVGAGNQIAVSSAYGDGNWSNNTVNGPISTCLAMSEVGATTTNRDSDNWMNVSEPMVCSAAP